MGSLGVSYNIFLCDRCLQSSKWSGLHAFKGRVKEIVPLQTTVNLDVLARVLDRERFHMD